MINISSSRFQILLNPSDSGKLNMVYAGSPLKNPQQQLSMLRYDHPHRPRNFSPYPELGSGDINEPALIIKNSNGQMTLDLKYDSVSQIKLKDGHKWNILLKDSSYAVEVMLKYRTWHDSGIMEICSEIINKGSDAITIQQASSALVRLRSDRYFLTHFAGDWANEMNLEEEEITRGIKILDAKCGARTTRFQNPSLLISEHRNATETEGNVLGMSLAWDGNWRFTIEKDETGDLQVQGGISFFAGELSLEAGTNMENPKMLLAWSDAGKGSVSRQFHDWANRYGMAKRKSDVPVLLNSWEGAYFNVNQKLLESFIDDTAAIGAGLFVLDDGWFGNGKDTRDNDRAGLGDWDVNSEKFPEGLGPVADYAASKGLQFGLWFEPEMVNPQSTLYRDHPDWIINNPGHEKITERFQYILDLGNPEVEAFAEEALDKYLREIPSLTYIKWDCNRHITSPGSAFARKSQSSIWYEYEIAFLRIISSLRKKHPGVLFQACASGGGRMNYGALEHFHEFWTSDNTDPHQRVFIQWGTSHFFPARAMASHVTASPNHQTGRETPMKFRFTTAMAGRLGLELQPSMMTSEEKAFSIDAIKAYNNLRHIVFDGDLFRLTSPYDGPLATLMYVSKDKKEALVFGWLLNRKAGDYYAPVKLQGLNDNKHYVFTEICKREEIVTPEGIEVPPAVRSEGTPFSGDFLMKSGSMTAAFSI